MLTELAGGVEDRCSERFVERKDDLVRDKLLMSLFRCETSSQSWSTLVAREGDEETFAMVFEGAATSMTLSARSANCFSPVPFVVDSKTMFILGGSHYKKSSCKKESSDNPG